MVLVAIGTMALSTIAAENTTKRTAGNSTVEVAPSKGRKVDLNKATKAELEALPGVGPVIADEIIAARPFKNVAELKKVRGIASERYDDIRPLVIVSPTLSKSSGAPATAARGSGDKPTQAAQERNRPAPGAKDQFEAPVPVAPRGTGEKPTQEVQERNRPAPGARGKIDTTPVPPGPRGISDKPTSEVQERNRHPAQREQENAAALQPRVDLNTGTREELESLPGIGPVKAQAIIDNRPYNSINEVTRVKGIKDATFEEIRDRIVVR